MDINTLNHISLRLLDESLCNNDNGDHVLAQEVRRYTFEQQQKKVGLGENWRGGKVEDGIVDSFKYDLPSFEYAFGYDYSEEKDWMGSGSSEATTHSGDGSSPKGPLQSQPSTPSPVSSLLSEPIGECANYTFLSWQQFQEILLKKQDLISKQIAGVLEGMQVGVDGEVVGLSPSVWPSLQEANCITQSKKKHPRARAMAAPATKPASTGGPHMAKTERLGTGVFLPDAQKSPPPSLPKKKAQTVFIPTRVVQTLNLKMEEIKSKAQSHLQIISQSDGASMPRHNNQWNKMAQKIPPQQDTRLPPEWIY